jgi:hypothetical protein
MTITVLFLWGALSDERTGLTFIYAAGPCQRNLSLVRVPWVSRPYFTVSHLRLPFSSPPTTRRVTVEVFDPASTRGSYCCYSFGIRLIYIDAARTTHNRKHMTPVHCRAACCLATISVRTYRKHLPAPHLPLLCDVTAHM